MAFESQKSEELPEELEELHKELPKMEKNELYEDKDEEMLDVMAQALLKTDLAGPSTSMTDEKPAAKPAAKKQIVKKW